MIIFSCYSAHFKDEYVWKKDENYRYEFYETTEDKYENVVGYTYKLFSQKWLNETFYELSNSGEAHPDGGQIWWHWVTIWVPHNLDPEMAKASFLSIGGSNNRDGFILILFIAKQLVSIFIVSLCLADLNFEFYISFIL